MSSYHAQAWNSKWRLENRPKREYIQYLHFDKGMSIEEIVDRYKWLLTKTEVMVMCDYFPVEYMKDQPRKKCPTKSVRHRPTSKNKLAWAIYNAGYTQEEFAKKVGLTTDYLKAKIGKKKKLSKLESEWWADVLHVDADWLAKGGDYDGSIPEEQGS